MSEDPNLSLFRQFTLFQQMQQQLQQQQPHQPQAGPQQQVPQQTEHENHMTVHPTLMMEPEAQRPMVISRQPSVAIVALPTFILPSKVLEDMEREIPNERELIKRLCALLKPTEKDLFPALLRLTLINPGEVTSSTNLRGKLVTAVKRLQTEFGVLFSFLRQSRNQITPESIGAQNLFLDFTLMAAMLAARLVGRWAILGRVDMYRNRVLNKDRFNGIDLLEILKQLGEDWLLGDHEPQGNINSSTRAVGKKYSERPEQ